MDSDVAGQFSPDAGDEGVFREKMKSICQKIVVGVRLLLAKSFNAVQIYPADIFGGFVSQLVIHLIIQSACRGPLVEYRPWSGRPRRS